MELKKYCEKLLYYKEKGIRFSTFFGKRWFISRIIAIFMSICLIYLNNQTYNIFGYFLIGFTVGAISIDIRTFLKTQKYWFLQNEIINWDKVEELAEDESQH